MNDDLFTKFRIEFQRDITEYTHLTLKEYLKNLCMIRNLSERQFEHLTDDLKLMIDYKSQDHSLREPWESIERGWLKS